MHLTPYQISLLCGEHLESKVLDKQNLGPLHSEWSFGLTFHLILTNRCMHGPLAESIVHVYHQVVVTAPESETALILRFALPTVYTQWATVVLEFHSLEWRLDH